MTEDTAYQATLDYLYSYVDYSMQRNFRNAPGKFDLARMRALVAALGDPQKQYPILHVAGTKGKGSVSALCASALKASGHRTGLYISPHLQDFTERIQIDGKPIPHADLVKLVDEVKPAIATIPEVTFFELTTALAFLYFARQDVDAAVVEVGLGGRLDATNVVVPAISVITSLSYDHTALLGDTLAQIAAEKAGIIKPNVPVVLAPQQQDEARQVVVHIATERNAPLIQVGKDFGFEYHSGSLDMQTFTIWPKAEPQKPVRLTIPLLGRHQVENAATAYAALQTVRASSLAVSEDAIREGFAGVTWPGRFEILRRNPPLILDCAHNRDSARKLRQTLDDYFPSQPVILVFGASEDKDVPGMFTELLPRMSEVITTRSFHPRAMEAEQLAELAVPFGKPVRIVPAIEDALSDALRLAEALRLAGDEAIVLVTGSIFIVAGARDIWQAGLRSSNER
jgi:dihydrofolate synthase/folylpolyglutamate synthase